MAPILGRSGVVRGVRRRVGAVERLDWGLCCLMSGRAHIVAVHGVTHHRAGWSRALRRRVLIGVAPRVQDCTWGEVTWTPLHAKKRSEYETWRAERCSWDSAGALTGAVISDALGYPLLRPRIFGLLDRAVAKRPGVPLVLLGHSLGGVIAYDYACARNLQNLALLVTMGCPLARRWSALPRGQQPALPDAPQARHIDWWLNLYEPSDTIGGPLGWSGFGQRVVRAVEDASVDTGWTPASHTAFVGDADVARAVVGKVCALGR